MSESYFSALRRVEDLLEELKAFDPDVSDYELDRIKINAENVFPEFFKELKKCRASAVIAIS